VQQSVCGDKTFVRFFGTYLLKNKFKRVYRVYTFQYVNHRNILRSECEEQVSWDESDITWSKILSWTKSNMSMNGHNADFSKQTLMDLNRKA